MKIITSVVFVFTAFIAFTDSYPNPRVNYGFVEPDMYSLPYENRQSLQEDTDGPDAPPPNAAPLDFNPFSYGPLSGFVQSMQAMMKRVQIQMGEVLSRMPPQDIDWGKLGNTTSHTKIVNDHLVTVNETTYKNSDADSHSVLHIKIVDVKPTTNGYNNDNNPTGVESVNKYNDNDKQHDVSYGNNNRNYPDTRSRQTRRQHLQDYGNLNPAFLDDVDNSVDVFQPMNPYDLSKDTLVNNLKHGQSKGGLIMIDPDAEFIDVEDGRVRPNYQSSPSQNFYNQQRSQPIFT